MIRTQPERNQVMVGRHIRDNLYSLTRYDYDDMGLVIAGIAEGRYHAEPIPEERKKPEQTISEKWFNRLRKWGWV